MTALKKAIISSQETDDADIITLLSRPLFSFMVSLVLQINNGVTRAYRRGFLRFQENPFAAEQFL